MKSIGKNQSPENGGQRRSGARKRSQSSAVSIAAKAATPMLLILYCLLLVWVPLPLGSNRPWPAAVLNLSIGFLLLLWGITAIVSPSASSPHQRKLWPAAMLFGIGMLFAVTHTIDLTKVDAALGTSLAGTLGHPIWGLASETLGQPLPAYVSVDPFLSAEAISKLLAYAGAFWLAFQLAQTKERATAILWAVTAAGALNVLIGIVEKSIQFDLGSWLSNELPGSKDRLHGTFVNPNHFATLASMSLVAAMALCSREISQGFVLNRGPDIARRSIVNTLSGPTLALIAAIVGIAGAITISQSRAGTIAMLVGSIVLAVCQSRWDRESRKTGMFVANWTVLVIVGIGVLIAAAPLAMRFNAIEEATIVRTAFMSDTLDAALAAPWTGNGFGAFEKYYPIYATQITPFVVNAAHNDYLEMISDLGFVGGGALILAAAYLAALALRGVIKRKRRRHLCAAGVAAAAICGVHAFLEFSLQIPAVGVFLFTLLGVAVAQSWQDRSEQHDPRMTA